MLHLVAIALTVSGAAPASTGRQLELLQSAEAVFGEPDKTYAKALEQRLKSDNPYERLLALKRLRALPQIAAGQMLASTVALADDTAPLYESTACLKAMLVGDAIDCATTSNAAQALAALRVLDPTLARQAILERVVARPDAAKNLASLVEPLFGDSASELVTRVKAASNVETQAALLLLGSELRCANNAYDVAQLAPLMTSQSPLVRFRTALVVLVRSDACEHQAAPTGTGHRARATALVEDAVKREEPLSALEDLARLGIAGSPLIGVLLTKLPNPNAVDALAAMKFRARGAVAPLVELLDRSSDTEVRGILLHALAAIRPGPESVREALLRTVRNTPLLLSGALKTLADVEAPLSASEFEYLSRLYRSHCKDMGSRTHYSYKRDQECNTSEVAMSSLAHRSSLRFEPLVPAAMPAPMPATMH